MSVALILAVLAAVAAAASLLEALRAVPPRRRAAGATPARPGAARTTPAAPMGAGRWGARSGDAAAERLLDAAGRGGGVPTVAVLRAREHAAALIAATWCTVLLVPVAGAAGAALVAVPAGLAGHRVPRLLLRRLARTRARELQDELPDALTLLAAGAACGLPLPALLALPGDWLTGPFADGLSGAAVDLDRGAAPDQVLAALARDHPIDEVIALVAILRRGRVQGVATAPALKALADGARAGRARRAGDRAARAAPRIQLVAALLLVPAALCILGAAMLSGGLG